MSDLSDRIISVDPRYQEIEASLGHVRALLNYVAEDGAPARLEALQGIEESLRDAVKELMPSVELIQLSVEVEAPREIFSKGVNIKIDDGVLTDVLDKGHGMQRSLIFSLLQLLIRAGQERIANTRQIILAIEEPELYIHPHCQRLVFRVLK